MAKCSICGKSVLFGNAVSHSHRRSNKMFKPNVKKVNVVTPAGNRRIYVCTSCLRSGKVQRAVREPQLSVDSIIIEEPVLEAVAAEMGVGTAVAEEAVVEAVAEAVEAAVVAEAIEEAAAGEVPVEVDVVVAEPEA